MTEQTSFEWAKQNRHNDKLAEFVFLFCPPEDNEDTPEIFRWKREVWLSKLSAALTSHRPLPQPVVSIQKQTAKKYKEEGFTNQQISEKMGVSVSTVKRLCKEGANCV